MKKFKALVIDDEQLARKAIISLIRDHPAIEVAGEADDVTQAVRLIGMHQPDLLFLDIQMPGKTGFDLLNEVDYQGKIIFITAYDEYALRAFEINALDYLMKPVSPDRFRKAMDRLYEQEERHAVPLKQDLLYDDRLFLLMGKHMIFLKISSIVHIQAEGDYTKIFTSEGKKGLILKSMKEWTMRLPASHFCRIHRSHIVNLDFVEEIEKESNYDFRVKLKKCEDSLVMSRRYARFLKEKMG
jgi:two-component system, LytTR family, response regulator